MLFKRNVGSVGKLRTWSKLLASRSSFRKSVYNNSRFATASGVDVQKPVTDSLFLTRGNIAWQGKRKAAQQGREKNVTNYFGILHDWVLMTS